MTPTEAYIIVGLIAAINLILIIFTIRWLSLHKYMIQLSEQHGNSFTAKAGRFRLTTKERYIVGEREQKRPMSERQARKIARSFPDDAAFYEWVQDNYKQYKQNIFFPIYDLLRRNPLICNDYEEYIINMESAPIIGPKYLLKLKKIDGENIAWKPPLLNSKTDVTHNLMAFIGQTREELYDATKLELSKAQLLAQIILPISIVILALGCLIFFPKVYETIAGGGQQALKDSVGVFEGLIEKVRPLP